MNPRSPEQSTYTACTNSCPAEYGSDVSDIPEIFNGKRVIRNGCLQVCHIVEREDVVSSLAEDGITPITHIRNAQGKPGILAKDNEGSYGIVPVTLQTKTPTNP